MPDIKVLIAGANPVMRIRLVKAVESAAGMVVTAEATDLPETYTRAEALEPNVVLVARELTLLPEFSLMISLFRALHCRWMVVDHRANGSGGSPGASGLPPIETTQTAVEICRRIEEASRLVDRTNAPAKPQPALAVPMRPGKLILMGSSTGGVDALLAVLSQLPPDCPPIALVQHTGQGFSESLIRLLARRCTVKVEAATTGMELRPGHVCVAAGSPGHLRLRPGHPIRVSLELGPMISGLLPSVDALFHSAVPFAAQVVAVLLTGMGRDGAEGLLELRRAGAVTIGQNEATSVVYGMPRAAWELGAVQHQVGLNDVAATILRACAAQGEERRVGQ
ncbi:MAG: chemotaxis protein CheB [Pseudorhodobacter sp.]|nr:chemotaxis protein CheB [Pseudorhodobacter sp.]